MYKSSVVICSGGMDSVTLAYEEARRGKIQLLSFDYGQRHKKELECARMCAEDLNVPWEVVDLTSLGRLLHGSSLSDRRVDVPDGHYSAQSMKLTIVPNRNSIMLNCAVGVAIGTGAEVVYTAVHSGDRAIYPDCREEFVRALNQLIRVATETSVRVEAPFVNVTKADIASIGNRLGVDWTRTWSCYKGGEIHCGRCGTCTERQEAFHLAGVEDPTPYEDAEFWKTAEANA